MIGMIVTGHGKFAPGALDALKLLVGEQEYCEAVEFEPSDSVEQLTEKIDPVCGSIETFPTKRCRRATAAERSNYAISTVLGRYAQQHPSSSDEAAAPVV